MKQRKKRMLLGTLGASLLGNLLTGKGTVRAGEGLLRAGEGIKKKAVMLPHLVINFEIEKYYENEPRFNGVYSRDNLPKTINLDKFADVGTHWIALYLKELQSKNNEVIYFDSFGVEYVPAEIMHLTGQNNIKTNIFRIQADNSIMCGCFCIGFIDFMFAGKNLIDFTSLFSPYHFEKNDKIILNYFK